MTSPALSKLQGKFNKKFDMFVVQSGKFEDIVNEFQDRRELPPQEVPFVQGKDRKTVGQKWIDKVRKKVQDPRKAWAIIHGHGVRHYGEEFKNVPGYKSAKSSAHSDPARSLRSQRFMSRDTLKRHTRMDTDAGYRQSQLAQTFPKMAHYDPKKLKTLAELQARKKVHAKRKRKRPNPDRLVIGSPRRKKQRVRPPREPIPEE